MSSEINEVSLAIGRLQSTVESHTSVHSQILEKLDKMDASLSAKLKDHDEHLEKLQSDLDERRGMGKMVAMAAGVFGAGAVEVLRRVF